MLSQQESQSKQQIKEVRKRLLLDFEYYAKHALKIRTKTGEIKPFILNKAQKYLLEMVNRQLSEQGRVRVIIPKARQLGLSTAVGGLQYWWTSQHKAQKALVVTHHSDSTRALFDMTKRFHDNAPTILKPSTKYSSRRELTFDLLDSSYMVATAGGEGIARGETITHAHLSELAWWPPGASKENLAGILQAVPNTAGTMVFIESTANGVSGPFYDMTQGALRGENGYDVCFLPWFWDESYRSEVHSVKFERTPDEEDLVKNWGLDNEQLQFRRQKVAQTGLDQWNQEYPTILEDAFLTSGRPVFDLGFLNKRLKEGLDVLSRMALEGTESAWEKMDWEENPRGELVIYRKLDPGGTYYIGADVAMGIKNGDYSVAQVLDDQKRQVAVWRGHVHPDYFAYILYHLGTYYNTAKIAVESNNHGLLTVHNLFKYLNYSNVFTDVVVDKVTDQETINLGFKTTQKTKPMIIDDLRAALREKAVELNDKITIREMMTFIVTETGKLEADADCHDDCVIALAIANHIHEGALVPVAVSDDWYVEAL